MGGGFTSWGLAVPGSRGSGGHPVEDRVSAPPTWWKAEAQVDEQFGEAIRSGTLGVRHGDGRVVPSDSGPRARARNADRDPGLPLFAAPGLVLLAALAIFAGYRWLNLFPNRSLQPTSLLFALAVAPATFALTRHVHAPQVPGTRVVARACAGTVLVLGLTVAVDHIALLSRVLGVTSLVLAVALVSLVVASERHRRSVAPRPAAGGQGRPEYLSSLGLTDDSRPAPAGPDLHPPRHVLPETRTPCSSSSPSTA
jgi:hypothetical protein